MTVQHRSLIKNDEKIVRFRGPFPRTTPLYCIGINNMLDVEDDHHGKAFDNVVKISDHQRMRISA